MIECAGCRGKGCRHCKDEGTIELTECARKQVPSKIWRIFSWVRRAEEKGILPVAGGGLDQTRGFLEAWEFVALEMREWEAKLRKK